MFVEKKLIAVNSWQSVFLKNAARLLVQHCTVFIPLYVGEDGSSKQLDWTCEMTELTARGQVSLNDGGLQVQLQTQGASGGGAVDLGV